MLELYLVASSMLESSTSNKYWVKNKKPHKQKKYLNIFIDINITK